MVAPGASPRSEAPRPASEDEHGQPGGPVIGMILANFFSLHPPPWFEQGADHEFGMKELIYVLQSPEAKPLAVNSALAIFLGNCTSRDALFQLSRSGGFEALTALVSGEHHITCAQVLAEQSQAEWVGRLVRAQAGQLLHCIMASNVDPHVKHRIFHADRKKIAAGVLDAALDAWQALPPDAKMLGELLDTVALTPLEQDETFELISGPRLDFVLSVLRAVVSWQGPYERPPGRGREVTFATHPECLSTPPERACVALYTTALMLKTLTGGHAEHGAAFAARVKSLLPRAAEDLGRHFGVLIGVLIERVLHPNAFAACLLGFADDCSAVVEAAPELPEARALREKALQEGERLRAASSSSLPHLQGLHDRFLEAWGQGAGQGAETA
eukprot:tig00021036_g17279.t1